MQQLLRVFGRFQPYSPTSQTRPYYSIDHSQKNFLAFIEAGGTGSFEEVAVRGRNNGHWVMAKPPLWEGLVGDYLDRLATGQE